MGDIMVDIMVATMGEADMGTTAIPVVIPVMEDMTMEEIMEIMGIMEEIMEGVDAVEGVDVVEEVEEMEEVEVAEEVGAVEEEDAVEIDRPKNSFKYLFSICFGLI